MELNNFREIKAIDEARAIKIIKWNEKTDLGIAITAVNGCNLDSISLIKLLSIFSNSKNIEKDIGRLFDELMKYEEPIEK
jgi:hypothetical protein